MTQQNAIKLFEQKQVRSVWDDSTEEWYFSVVDVVAALTDSVNPADYIKKMRRRDPELSKGWGQIVTPLAVQTAGGKQKMNCATASGRGAEPTAFANNAGCMVLSTAER